MIYVASRGGMGDGDVRLGAAARAVSRLAQPGDRAGRTVLRVPARRRGRRGDDGAGKAGTKTALPFGPFLAAGTVLAIFVGQEFVDLFGIADQSAAAMRSLARRPSTPSSTPYIADTRATATKPTIDADEDDHDRLEHRRELLDAALELAVEVLAGDLELLVERSGLLADLEHLLRGAGEQPGRRASGWVKPAPSSICCLGDLERSR